MAKRNMHELSKVSNFIYNCRKCGLCGYKVSARVPYVCPVREQSAGFEHFCSRGKIVIAQGLLEGNLDLSPDLAEAIYSCTLCGNCMTQCATIDNATGEPLVNTSRIVEALRADLLREHPGFVDRAYHVLLNSTRQYDNPWGAPRTTRGKWAKGLSLKDAQKEPAEVLLFVGCTIPSNQALMPRLKKAVAILQQAGVDFAVLGKNEPCCGSVQRRVGDLGLAREMMEKNIRLFNSLGCKTMVTLCAGCCHTLKKDSQQAIIKLKPNVYHLVEFLEKLVKNKTLSFSKNMALKVTYHDPCHLGRHMGIYDPPREILKSIPGIELVERTATRENTICCGAGGGMRIFAGGVLAEKIAKASLAQAQEAGVRAVVTSCPFCEMNLSAAAQRLDPAMPVYDIIDVVADAIDR